MFAPPLAGDVRWRPRVAADPGRWGARPPEVRTGADRTQAEPPFGVPGLPAPAPLANTAAGLQVSHRGAFLEREVRGQMKAVHAKQAPEALGPYSQAVEAKGVVYSSGQVGLDPRTGELVEGVEAQARQVMQNLQAVLSAAGLDLAHVAKTTIYLADMADFATVNDVYAEFFAEPYPARSTVQVARLPMDARIEMDVVALRP
jgi:2-iminobutanoate/2-iminopropanoate deaminase